MISRAKMDQPKPTVIELVPASKCPLWVTSVALCNRPPPVDFRYARLTTGGAWRCNMSRRAKKRSKSLPSLASAHWASRSLKAPLVQHRTIGSDPSKSLRPDEYARDQYDFAEYINCLHRHLAIADGSRVDLSDPVSYSNRYGQFPFLELPSRSRST